MNNKTIRGGARKGAGRKLGSGAGRKVITSSINMLPEIWAKLDDLRAGLTRSAWIANQIKSTPQETQP